jgi:hypothetical protein
MNALELEALAEEIRVNGLRTPIVRYQGKILDGRNRLSACEEASVQPRFEDFTGTDAEALALVLSLNAARRDMTNAQRTITAARLWTQSNANGYSKGGRPKKGKPGDIPPVSLRQLERIFRTDHKTIQLARDLLKGAPDLAEQVSQNLLSIKEACQQMEDRRVLARQKAEDAKRVSKFAEAISKGEMTMEEALHEVIEQEREEKEHQENVAASRRSWLEGLERCCHWFETHVAKDCDSYLTSITTPGAPGLEGHSITHERLAGVVTQINRLCSTAFPPEPKQEPVTHGNEVPAEKENKS